MVVPKLWNVVLHACNSLSGFLSIFVLLAVYAPKEAHCNSRKKKITGGAQAAITSLYS